MKSRPLALKAYETIAEQYAARVDTKPHNAFYERPATLSLLPAVRGRRVLDAGCGPGVYSEWLADHGAQVTALDVSPKMVRLARARLRNRVEVHQVDLNLPLDFLADATFDLIISPLVLDYLQDWDAVFHEFHRLLKAPGTLVFSCGHPFADFAVPGAKNYFHTEQVEYTWRGFGEPVRMPFYRRPLQALIAPLLGAGFTLERLLEPTPLDEFRQTDPDEYEKLSRRPGFMCVRAAKQPAAH